MISDRVTKDNEDDSLLEGLDLEWSLINNANGSLVPFDLFFVLPEKLSV